MQSNGTACHQLAVSYREDRRKPNAPTIQCLNISFFGLYPWLDFPAEPFDTDKNKYYGVNSQTQTSR